MVKMAIMALIAHIQDCYADHVRHGEKDAADACARAVEALQSAVTATDKAAECSVACLDKRGSALVDRNAN